MDSLRGLAALYVAIAHARGILWMGGSKFTELHPVASWSVWDYVKMGISMSTRLAVEFVIIFFVLSGFSIAHSVSKSKSVKGFFKRRFIRLYPPYVSALVYAGLITGIAWVLTPHFFTENINWLAIERYKQMNDFFAPQTIVSNLLYMPSQGFITPFWSLTYEVIFYLIAPFLLITGRVQYYLLASIIIWMSGLLFPILVHSSFLSKYMVTFLFTYNIYFALGVFLYLHRDKIARKFFNIIGKKKNLVVIPPVLSLMTVYAINFYTQSETTAGFVASALFSCLLIIILLEYEIRVQPLIKVGEFSYTLYITHVASIFLIHTFYFYFFQPNVYYIEPFWIWPLGLLFSLVMAFLTYTLVEKRTKVFLDYLRKKTYK